MMYELAPVIDIYLHVLVLLTGACIGSFLNVCIVRIPLEQSTVRPASHCPTCQQPIAWYDNIPVASYIALRGRCRRCGTRISPRYALVETLTAALFFAIWLKYGWSAETPVYWLVVSGLILGTFVDFEHMIIPDRVSLGGMLAGVILSTAFPVIHGASAPLDGLLASGIGLAIGAGSLWLVAVLGKLAFKKDAMGLGDVKLLGAIGAFMGWQGVLFTVMISSLAGSLVGLFLVFGQRREWQSRIPYGPYLALAAVIWLLWGQEWWQAYIQWMSGI